MKKREYKFTDGILYLKCTWCSEWKPSWDYHKAKNGLFGFRAECKECISDRCRDRYSSKRDEIAAQNKEYYWNNKEKISSRKKRYYRATWRQTNYSNSLTEKLWFNRHTFHLRARNYAKRFWLIPSKCSICWIDGKIELHHPKCGSYDDRSKVVFCCHSCHRRIHSWNIDNPMPVDLLNLNNTWTIY